MATVKKTYRKSLTLREKVAIIKAADGRPHRQLAEIFQVGRTQVRTILLNKEEILHQAETLNPNQRRRPASQKTALNEKVAQWYVELQSQNEHITGPMIKDKATEIAAEMELFEFAASDGWLWRFKTRHLAQRKPSSGGAESEDGNTEEAGASLPKVLQGFAPRDVFTLEETSLLYRALPDKALYDSDSDPNERLTLLFCVNFMGETQKTLAIGNNLHPPCFRTMDRRDLPLTWRADKEALMTSVLFEEWVGGFNNRMQLEDRHVLLLLKNMQSHPDTVTLSNVKMEFLPAIATSILNQGFIQHIKALYRKQFLEHVIQGAEALSNDTDVTTSDIVSRVNFYHALNWLEKATLPSPDVVQKCFHSFYMDTGAPMRSLKLDCGEIQEDSLVLAEMCHEACAVFNIANPMAGAEYCEIDSQCPIHSEIEIMPSAENSAGLQDDDAESKDEKSPTKLKKSYRKSLTLRQKVAIIQAAEGRSHRQLADTFEIGKSQVWNILQRRDEILTQFTLSPDSNMRRVRKSNEMTALNAYVFEWYNGCRTRKEKVTGAEIRTKALEIAAELGLDNFCASSGWLTKFKSRHNISERRVPSEQDGTIVVAPYPSVQAHLPELPQGYVAKDVYTMEETALLYRALPDKTLRQDVAEERLTLLLCVNYEGEFQKSVLIGQRKCPPCFKRMDRSFFPLTWRANKRALMTQEFFQEWVVGFNNRMLLQNRHVILLLNKRESHSRTIALSHVKMVFLPSDTRSILNQGTIQQLKGQYRQQLLEHLIQKSDYPMDDPVSDPSDDFVPPVDSDNVSAIAGSVIDRLLGNQTGTDKNTSDNPITTTASGTKSHSFDVSNAPYTTIDAMRSVNVYQAITWLHKAISEISLATVQSCFHHCEINLDMIADNVDAGGKDMLDNTELASLCRKATGILRLPEPISAADYCDLDDGCPVHDEMGVQSFSAQSMSLQSTSGNSDNELDDDVPDDVSDVEYEVKPTKLFSTSIQSDTYSSSIPTPESTGRYQAALCQQLWCLRSEGVMCDVVFDIGGEPLFAHRIILSACSPYLKACCLNPSAMSQDGLVQIKVDGYSYKVCVKLIEFLYTGKLLDTPRSEFWQLCAEWQIIGTTGEPYTQDEAYSDDGTAERERDTEQKYFAELADMQLGYGGKGMAENMKKEAEILAKGNRTRTRDIHPMLDSAVGLKRGRKRKGDSDSGIAKKSCQTSTQKTTQNVAIASDGELTAAPPPLLTNEWISSCLKDDNTSTENQQLYDGDTCDESLSETALDDAQSDLDEPKFTPRPTTTTTTTTTKKLIPDVKNPTGVRFTKAGVAFKGDSRRKRAKDAKAKLLSQLRKGECPVCGDMFETPAKLYLHKATVHRNKQNGWCKICKLRFPDKNKLQVHNVASHYKEGMELPRLFTCQEENCAFKTYSRKSMFSHKKIVHQAERSICDLCGKSLKSEASLRQHHKHMHDATFNKDHPCQKCDRIFKTYVGLSRHMMGVHTEAGQREKHVCPRCGYTAFTGSTMTEHLFKKHDVPPPKGKPSYKCKHCAFKTTKIRDIRNHELRHEPEKRFQCDQCSRCYPTQREVNRHRRLKHAKNKQEIQLLQCEQCDYTTKYGKGALRSHIAVKHEDSRPWICSICSYRTKLKGNLHKHIRNVHKCPVKTNWTLTKVSRDGQCSENYRNPPGRSFGAVEPGNSDEEVREEEERRVARDFSETGGPSATVGLLPASVGDGVGYGAGLSLPGLRSMAGIDQRTGGPAMLGFGMERYGAGNLAGLVGGVGGVDGRGGVVQPQYDLLTSMGTAPPSLAHIRTPSEQPLFSHLDLHM